MLLILNGNIMKNSEKIDRTAVSKVKNITPPAAAAATK